MKLFRKRSGGEVPRRRSEEHTPRDDSSTRSNSQFYRNRTLSSVRYETPESSARTRVHHLTNQRRKIGGIFFIVLASIALIGVLLTQMTARVVITSTTTALSSPIDGPKYEKIINDYLGIHPAERLRFLINQDELSTYVIALAPEIASISQAGADNIVETRFAITFRQPIAGWQINNRQYYVDNRGVVFEKNYYKTPSVQIVDESGISPEQGSTVASARFLSFVGKVVGLSKDGGYEVVEARLPTGTTRQLEVRIKDTVPFVKFSIDRGAGEQVEDMIRSLNYLRDRGVAPTYVDVRMSGRAVYQ